MEDNNEKFNVAEYLEGLTGFVFDKAVIKRIALERGVWEVESFADMTQRQKDLCKADLLYTAYCSPDVIASSTLSHGSFSKTIGSQTIQQKDKLLDMALALYRKWDDEMLEEVEGNTGNLRWLDSM